MDSIEKMLFNRSMRDAFESDREDNGVREQWAEDHGYNRYRCPECHKTFWSDSGDGCPTCGRYDLGEIGDDGPTSEHYGDSVEDSVVRAAKQANEGFMFFFNAMKRNGVL